MEAVRRRVGEGKVGQEGIKSSEEEVGLEGVRSRVGEEKYRVGKEK